ncbi:TraR/DksA family transcriptional regulator [Maritalea mediterranea]|uniref:TraR/DksA C4-type zinc finger protein n=1 Tax=Maritalea mediterranea TaxID=2909667 RepID=A0ABS9E5L4_9HYPH|nr:TraR/DksA C4-type zinc finger protein [Maritalea mediterranea]MCF4098068.1 TraR/DksA C4-type zinc finger protein [Maritalea mediterranea]
MDELSAKEIAAFKDILLAKQQELQAIDALGEEARQAVELDQQSVGRLSRMDAMQGQAMAQAQKRHRQRERTRIEMALTRIENDDYGFCEDCGDPIAKQRLEVDPAAAFCIRCAAGNE